jgi:hypothetical protein
MTLRITPITSVGRKTRDYHGIDFDSDATRNKTKVYYDGNGNARILSEKYSKEAINQIMDTIDVGVEQTIKATPAISKITKDRVWLTDHNEKYNNIETPDYGNSDAYALRYCLAQQHSSSRNWNDNVNSFAVGESLKRIVIPNLDTQYRIAKIDISGGPVVFTFADMPEKSPSHFVSVQWFDMFGNHVGHQLLGNGETRIALIRSGDSDSVSADHLQVLPQNYAMGFVRIQRQALTYWSDPTSEQLETRTPDTVSMWNVEPSDYNLNIAIGSAGESIRYMLQAMTPEDFTSYTDKLLEYIFSDLSVEDKALSNSFINDELKTQSFYVNVTEETTRSRRENVLSNGWIQRLYDHYDEDVWIEKALRQRNAILLLPLNDDTSRVEYGLLEMPKKEFYFTFPAINATNFWSFTCYNHLMYLDSINEYTGSQLGLQPGPDGYKIFVTRNRPANLDNSAGEYWLPSTDTSCYINFRVYGSDGNRVENLSKITLL